MALRPADYEQLKAPKKIADLGIPEGLVEDLFLRHLYAFRTATINAVSVSMSVSHPVADEVARRLRDKKLIEFHGADGRDYRIGLTEVGQRTVNSHFKNGKHVSDAPIPIKDYVKLVELQGAQVDVDRDLMHEAFSDLVLEDYLIDQIGPALAGEGAIFLYGPPGTGKTSIAEGMKNIYDDYIAIPKYVEVEGQIISVYDPAIHTAIDNKPEDFDNRFVLCERPIIIAGGELNLTMLELQYDTISGISMAPLQMLANNGILVVDDFGRQTVTPEEILNRWIVPLTHRVDYLRSNAGNKITIPFELKLVFSTNLKPELLGDDAFLRRLHNKIFVGSCSQRSFDWILNKSAEKYDIEITDKSSEWVTKIAMSYLGELRPYIAVDFCSLAKTVCKYEGRPLRLDEEVINKVAQLYFIRGDDPSSFNTTSPVMGQEEPASQERRKIYN